MQKIELLLDLLSFPLLSLVGQLAYSKKIAVAWEKGGESVVVNSMRSFREKPKLVAHSTQTFCLVCSTCVGKSPSSLVGTVDHIIARHV